MRTAKVVLLAVALAALAATAAATPLTGSSSEVPDKATTSSGHPTYEGRVEGETIETPFVIDYLPFVGTGDTCPFLHDYDESCPYTGSDSPDVVYRYECQYSCWVVIDLCASSYDTKVFVYENAYTPGFPLVCNDDYPGCGPNGYRSYTWAEFEEGNTYYIVVDGYTGACGEYELYVEHYLPCVWCPDGSVIEDEPDCIDPVNDGHNGGCNADPPVFQVLSPSDETIWVCGTSGTYYVSGQNYRDTDWFEINLPQEMTITLKCIADFNVRIGFVDGREGCEGVSAFYSYADGYICYQAYLSEPLPPGTWWVWVGPIEFTDVLCGTEYMLSIDGYTSTTPVENVAWGTIKALFR